MVPIFNDGIWKLEALSDSHFSNDKDPRYRVYGYIIYFYRVTVAWKSKSMKHVVLSTTEAEYVKVSGVVKEIKILYQMLRRMEIKVPLPIKVQVNKIGAIWFDTTYIKTQVFRLLRYYSPAPKNIARSDWETQNITHNMTSSKT